MLVSNYYGHFRSQLRPASFAGNVNHYEPPDWEKIRKLPNRQSVADYSSPHSILLKSLLGAREAQFVGHRRVARAFAGACESAD
jgi:hypothetical protein